MRIAFVSLSRQRHRYFNQIVSRVPEGISAFVLGGAFGPSRFLFRVRSVDQGCYTELQSSVQIQLNRQKHNYPRLFAFDWVQRLFCRLALAVEISRYNSLVERFTQLGISDVAVWNGQKPPYTAVVFAAKSLGLRVWYFENGIAPGFTTLDPLGVNAQSCLPLLSDEVLGLSDDASEALSEPTAIAHQGGSPLHVLVPLQVESDTQLIAQAGWVNNSQMLVACVQNTLAALELERGYQLLVRPHPKSRQAVNFPKSNKMTIDNQSALADQLAWSDVVLTINSSVGFEALCAGKPVCHLAPSLYSREGVAYYASSPDSLMDALRQVATLKPDLARAQSFTEFVLSTYLIPGDWRQVDSMGSEHFDAIWARLIGSDALMVLWKNRSK